MYLVKFSTSLLMKFHVFWPWIFLAGVFLDRNQKLQKLWNCYHRKGLGKFVSFLYFSSSYYLAADWNGMWEIVEQRAPKVENENKSTHTHTLELLLNSPILFGRIDVSPRPCYQWICACDCLILAFRALQELNIRVNIRISCHSTENIESICVGCLMTVIIERILPLFTRFIHASEVSIIKQLRLIDILHCVQLSAYNIHLKVNFCCIIALVWDLFAGCG